MPQTVPLFRGDSGLDGSFRAWKSSVGGSGLKDYHYSCGVLTRPFTLRRLGNGIRVGVGQNPAESQCGHLRITTPHADK